MWSKKENPKQIRNELFGFFLCLIGNYAEFLIKRLIIYTICRS